MLLPLLKDTVIQLENGFISIKPDRKKLLESLTAFIEKRRELQQPINLNFICTHNSRRSHIAQLWAQAAAHYYKIDDVICLSGGTEATAFNPRAVKAMMDVGFKIDKAKEGDNPVYHVFYSDDQSPIVAFSKKYDDVFNSCKDFAAIMTCSLADENCPIVSGASARIAITYNDPKEFDGTELEELKYHERVLEIGREMLYAFSKVK